MIAFSAPASGRNTHLACRSSLAGAMVAVDEGDPVVCGSVRSCIGHCPVSIAELQLFAEVAVIRRPGADDLDPGPSPRTLRRHRGWPAATAISLEVSTDSRKSARPCRRRQVTRADVWLQGQDLFQRRAAIHSSAQADDPVITARSLCTGSPAEACPRESGTGDDTGVCVGARLLHLSWPGQARP